MQQLFEMRIVREFFQCAPILLAGFFAKLLAHRRQIQAMLLLGGRFFMIFVVMPMVMIVVVVIAVIMNVILRGGDCLRTLQNS